MTKEYVEKREGAYRISGTRVSLDSIVYAFLRGAAPESIAHRFPPSPWKRYTGPLPFTWLIRPKSTPTCKRVRGTLRPSASKLANRIPSSTGNSRKRASTSPSRENEDPIPGRR